MRLEWKRMALMDRENIMDYISQDNPQAAIDLDDEFETAAERARGNPDMYKPGRVKDTREIVVRPHYILVYQTEESVLTVLRILHAAQQWPPAI
ncbi:type II toxin-antitoxin system RelE/ParE family toxin [Salmonella enterica]|nr:type II toxin-antitoxin system RelE/ParE family toxin [Salmonella enterica]ECS6156334.1 type II toxin-antitoxin system RelE/ParE family toxin [Salmonella enterica subsp. enterica serovar Javiana]EBR7649366.1 type II toxin-antitoxin system RelE/ParE family toxin [Salmonella enterica]EDQ6154864.1 type II toxin-antitoxin system RelE/ParE family toxin [Salmonella enterica subsp. enterica serovar Javiana]EEC5487965.1 type II toxin-antitoxin system RelE/ParE family toxin [Salmonella enterica]